MACLNREQIMEVIPHRDPFLLIDEVEYLEPGAPVQPGVLTIEMLAQTGAVCALSLEENKGKTAFFGGIDKAKFRRMVKPGETLTLSVEFIKTRGNIVVGKGVATVDGEKAVSCEFTCIIVE